MSGEWAVFATVALAHALAVASPGPDFAMVVRQSLAFGRSAGLWTAAGIGSGIIFHVAYGLFGLGWLTTQFPNSLRLIGAAGAAFLVYMGLQALRAQPRTDSDLPLPPAQAGDRKKFFGIGLLTNLLNPKAMLFFVALFSVVVVGKTTPIVWLALGTWLPLATFGWFAFVAVMLGSDRARNRLRRIAHYIDRAMGAILLLLGGGMLVELLS